MYYIGVNFCISLILGLSLGASNIFFEGSKLQHTRNLIQGRTKCNLEKDFLSSCFIPRLFLQVNILYLVVKNMLPCAKSLSSLMGSSFGETLGDFSFLSEVCSKTIISYFKLVNISLLGYLLHSTFISLTQWPNSLFKESFYAIRLFFLHLKCRVLTVLLASKSNLEFIVATSYLTLQHTFKW